MEELFRDDYLIEIYLEKCETDKILSLKNSVSNFHEIIEKYFFKMCNEKRLTVEVMQMLIDIGFDIHQLFDYINLKLYILQIPTVLDNYAVVELLLKNGVNVDPYTVNINKELPLNPLFAAPKIMTLTPLYRSISKNKKMEDLLLAYGADPNFRDEDGELLYKLLIKYIRGVAANSGIKLDEDAIELSSEELLDYLELLNNFKGSPEQHASLGAIIGQCMIVCFLFEQGIDLSDDSDLEPYFFKKTVDFMEYCKNNRRIKRAKGDYV